MPYESRNLYTAVHKKLLVVLDLEIEHFCLNTDDKNLDNVYLNHVNAMKCRIGNATIFRRVCQIWIIQ